MISLEALALEARLTHSGARDQLSTLERLPPGDKRRRSPEELARKRERLETWDQIAVALETLALNRASLDARILAMIEQERGA